MKICTKCKQEKELTAFSQMSKTDLRLRPWCKTCRSSQAMANYYSDPQKSIDRARAWKKNNRALVNETNTKWRRTPEGVVSEMLARAKRRSKKDNLPFAINSEDIQVPALCPVFGVPLEMGVGKGPSPWSPSLDKIIPNLGYVPGNVIVMSHKANLMKNSASQEELLLFAKWVFNFVANPLTGDLA